MTTRCEPVCRVECEDGSLREDKREAGLERLGRANGLTVAEADMTEPEQRPGW